MMTLMTWVTGEFSKEYLEISVFYLYLKTNNSKFFGFLFLLIFFNNLFKTQLDQQVQLMNTVYLMVKKFKKIIQIVFLVHLYYFFKFVVPE